MSDLEFEIVDWEDGDGLRGRELGATLGRLIVRAGGAPVTEVRDARSRNVRQHILIPLYPVAEWIALHWWVLLYEPESPQRKKYGTRHDLRHGREGHAFPSVVLRPVGGLVAVEWSPLDLPLERLRFMGHGRTFVALEAVRERLADLVTTVLARLEAQGVRETPLHDEWHAIETCDDEERAFCIAAARAGLDPYGLEDADRASLLAAHECLAGFPDHWREEFLAAADASRLLAQAQVLKGWHEAPRTNGVDLAALAERKEWCAAQSVAPHGLPWEQGYDVARQLRSKLGAGDEPLPTHEALAGALGISEIGIDTVEAPAGPRSFDGALDAADTESPMFLTTKHWPDQVRFAFARALFEYLTGGSRPTALLTTSLTERQQRNRAFAAEFLAPKALLASRLSTPVIHPDEIEDVANDIGVSSMLVEHQIKNHELGTIAEY